MEQLATLGINWQSLLAYAVNFGILFWLVSKFLVPKVLHFLDERAKTISSNLSEAEELRLSMEKKAQNIQKEKEKSRLEMRKEIEETRKSLEEEKAKMLAEIEKTKSDMLLKLELEVASKKASILKESENRVREIIFLTVKNLLSEEMTEEQIKNSISRSWKNIVKQ